MPVFSYEQLRKMNLGEFRVYNFMVSHLEMVPEMNIRQIAGGAGVSATTVLRFCEKAGCSGYTELKYRVRQELDRSDRKGSFDADPAIQYMKNAEKTKGLQRKWRRPRKSAKPQARSSFRETGRGKACPPYPLLPGRRGGTDFSDQWLQKSGFLPGQCYKYGTLSDCTDDGNEFSNTR